nr:transposase [Zooshikella ganghwensis]
MKIVMLIQTAHNKGSRVLLYSTDTKLEAITIIDYYKARFQIEFLFRDAKQHTGFTHCQSRKKEATHTHLNASLSAINVLKL